VTDHHPLSREPSPETVSSVRLLADQALSRAAGAPLLPGNNIRLLKDAAENYPAWLDAIRGATRTIHFEIYIIHEDDIGHRFADALITKQQEGVQVRLLYDWMGALGKTSRRFWRPLREAGIEVRCFNPPRLSSPLSWLSRDHRKMLAVDGRVGFVTGLCIGQMWVGDPARGIEPWRDTGVEVQGPAVAAIEQAFAQIWATTGPPLPKTEIARREDLSPAGTIGLRVIASEPSEAELYRLDTLIAAVARRSLWLTDAYFVGTTTYVRALIAAARDGIDVRLLVPGSSDIALVRAISRAGYRSLLEGGVRVFEWKGPMMHAKTAVADGQWARVGSTNLNPASWIGNWELDVAVEDEGFARQMEAMFLEDLQHATEIVLSARRKVRPTTAVFTQPAAHFRRGRGSTNRAVAGALRIGNAVSAAITNRRVLGPAEATVLSSGGLLLFILAVVAVLWPRVIAIPLAILSGWVGIALLSRAYNLRFSKKKRQSRR